MKYLGMFIHRRNYTNSVYFSFVGHHMKATLTYANSNLSVAVTLPSARSDASQKIIPPAEYVEQCFSERLSGKDLVRLIEDWEEVKDQFPAEDSNDLPF